MVNGYVNMPDELQGNILEKFQPGIEVNVPGMYRKITDIYKLRKPVIGHFELGFLGDVTLCLAIAKFTNGDIVILTSLGDYGSIEISVFSNDNVLLNIRQPD